MAPLETIYYDWGSNRITHPFLSDEELAGMLKPCKYFKAIGAVLTMAIGVPVTNLKEALDRDESYRRHRKWLDDWFQAQFKRDSRLGLISGVQNTPLFGRSHKLKLMDELSRIQRSASDENYPRVKIFWIAEKTRTYIRKEYLRAVLANEDQFIKKLNEIGLVPDLSLLPQDQGQ